MLLTLTPHPQTPCDAISALTVELTRPRSTGLRLHYRLEGDIPGIIVPGRVRPSRADELWQTTCFEAFVRSGPGADYYEFNLSPSGQWAAYSFSDYREGMTPHAGVELRDPDLQVSDDRLELAATLDLDRLGLGAEAVWRVGLSTVIEETSGRKSYWALTHAPGKPDFHHPDSFACVLEPS
jgi:hypothetical protein